MGRVELIRERRLRIGLLTLGIATVSAQRIDAVGSFHRVVDGVSEVMIKRKVL